MLALPSEHSSSQLAKILFLYSHSSSSYCRIRNNIMCSFFWLKVLIVLLTVYPIPLEFANTDATSLQLRVMVTDYPVSLSSVRDENKTVLFMEGTSVEMLKWLARFNHFSYTVEPITAPFFVNSSNQLGAVYYINAKLIDLAVGAYIMTSERIQYVDFPHSSMAEPSVLVIPAPDLSPNFDSIWQPFQLIVWILILLSVILVMFFLYFLMSPRVSSLRDKPPESFYTKNRMNKLGFFVFGLLLSQGGYFKSSHLPNRFVAGAWCLATFVLVQAYSSTLISFVTTPISTPLVKSPEDLAQQSHVHLIVRVDYATDTILSNSQDSFLKKLGDKIRNYPRARCLDMAPCLNQVAQGGSVFIHGYRAVLEGMNDDFIKTGQCRFSIVKKTLLSNSYAWALQKHSQWTEPFNRGILQMKEKGLIDKWINQFQVKPRRCQLDRVEFRRHTNTRPSRLTLKNFYGAFALLGIGSTLSIIIFLCEKIYKPIVIFINKNSLPCRK